MKLDMFKYFLECYFCQSFDYADLPDLAKEFYTNESDKYKEDLLREIHSIIDLSDWQYISDYVKKYGERTLSVKKVERMINIILNNFKS